MPLRLVFKNLKKHGLRSVLTVGGIAIAIFLLCVLRSLVVSLDAGVRGSATNRLIAQSAVSLFVDLPLSYESKIEAVPGVEEITPMQWFGGYYQDSSNFFAQFAIDPEPFLDIYREIEVVDGDLETFKTQRTAALIGWRTAEKYGFEVGDALPLIGAMFPRTDGSVWDFQVAAIYRADSTNMDESTMYFHFDYLRESIEQGGAQGTEGVGVYVMRIAPDADRLQVMAEVDALFENGPQRVQTASEAEFQAQFVSMLGSVPALLNTIGTGVLIAILLAVLNTMLMSGREQTRDVGVLKALGFSDSTVFAVLLAQALVLCLVGGALGIGLALLAQEPIRVVLGTSFPNFHIADSVQRAALAITVALGLVAGFAPAWRARGLQVVDALRRVA